MCGEVDGYEVQKEGSEKLSNFFPAVKAAHQNIKLDINMYCTRTHPSIYPSIQPKQLMPVHKMNVKKMCKSEIALLLTGICQPLVISISSHNVRKYT